MYSGNDLLSQEKKYQVSSALKGLTSVFGMGTGVSPSLLSPDLREFSHLSKRHSNKLLFRLSLRLISISPLNVSLHLHS